MVKLSQIVTGHFVSLIEVSVAIVDLSVRKKGRGNCLGWEGELCIRFTCFWRWARPPCEVGFLSWKLLGASLIHSRVLWILFITSSWLHGVQVLSALVQVNPGGHATRLPRVESKSRRITFLLLTQWRRNISRISIQFRKIEFLLTTGKQSLWYHYFKKWY